MADQATLFDHVDLRVADLAAARPLYDALLQLLGFTKMNADAESVGYHRPGETGAEPFLWLVEDRDHVPNGTRIAFTARSRHMVEHCASAALACGAREFEPAQPVPEYGPSYYATFFTDASGNQLEVCCRR